MKTNKETELIKYVLESLLSMQLCKFSFHCKLFVNVFVSEKRRYLPVAGAGLYVNKISFLQQNQSK